MTEPQTSVVRVGYGYGQFYLRTSPEPATSLESAYSRASDGPGIGQSGGTLAVISPEQWNSDLALCVECWQQEPSDDHHAWQVVTEASITITEFGLIFTSEDGEFPIPVVSGQYRIRISGRGFSTPPVVDSSSWRLQLWPDSAATEPRAISSFRP